MCENIKYIKLKLLILVEGENYTFVLQDYIWRSIAPLLPLLRRYYIPT